MKFPIGSVRCENQIYYYNSRRGLIKLSPSLEKVAYDEDKLIKLYLASLKK